MNTPRQHDPNADTMIPLVDRIRAVREARLKTATPLSSTVNQVNPNIAKTAEKKSGSHTIRNITIAAALAVAGTLGLYECKSTKSPQIEETPVSTALEDAGAAAENVMKDEPKLPEPKNDKEKLRRYLQLNNALLTSENFDHAFADTPETPSSNNKYIQVMKLVTTPDFGNEVYTPHWEPVTEALSTCDDTGGCIYAIRAKKDRYRGLVSFLRQNRPLNMPDQEDPNILYAVFTKKGYSSIEVLNPGSKKRLFLIRVKIDPKNSLR